MKAAIDTVERAYQLAYEHDISIQSLCRMAGVNRSTLDKARVRGSSLSVDTIFKFSRILDISPAVFFMTPEEAYEYEQLRKHEDLCRDQRKL